MRDWITRAALIGALLAMGTPALAGDGFGGRHGHRGPPLGEVLERHAAELGLDEAAVGRIRAIEETSRPERDALREELHGLRTDLHALLEADAPDEAAVMAQVEEIGAVKTELQKHRVRTLLAVRAELTPEQRAKLVELREARRAKRHGRFMDRHDEPGPPE